MPVSERLDFPAVRIEAPAKVNLLIEVLAREESGYHQIETVFQAVSLHDSLCLRAAARGIGLEVEGADVGPVTENLAFRAAERFLGEVGGGGVYIHLHKRIPAGAGLGGGSSDAAAVLRALNFMRGHPLPQEELLRMAGRLGADVAFFASARPLALGWGRGDRLLDLPPLPAAPVLLVFPPRSLRTATAYSWLATHRAAEPLARAPRMLCGADLRDWPHVARLARNDFEEVVLARAPELRDLLGALRATGAGLAMLSGSGSAMFAVFSSADEATEAGKILTGNFPGTSSLTAWTLERIPDPEPDVPARA